MSALDKARAATGVARDAKDRHEATYNPDARKARDLVNELGHLGNLAALAHELSRRLSSIPYKEALKAAFDRFANAHQIYITEELLAPDSVIGWVGGDNGVLGPLPPNTPEHKAEFQLAWTELLTTFNEITRVGVMRDPLTRHVKLLADIDTVILPRPTNTDFKWD